MSDDNAEIIPPNAGLPARRSRSTELAQARESAPRRVHPGGIVSSAIMRWEANRHARTYDALASRTSAEKSLVDADTALGHSLIQNARMRHEYDELPRTLSVERAKRELQRVNEICAAHHELELAHVRRLSEQARAEAELSDARVVLTQSRERLTQSRKSLLNASQEFDAQQEHGRRFHDLEWKQKIGEREMVVEEQQFLLSEHRKRMGAGPEILSDEELLQNRAELNADGGDTSAIDQVLERRKARGRK